MTDQKPQVRAIRHFSDFLIGQPKTAGQGDQTRSDVSDRFTENRRSGAIRHFSTQKRSEKRSESDQTDQKKTITAGQAIRKIQNLSDRLAIRKPRPSLYKGRGSDRPIGKNQ